MKIMNKTKITRKYLKESFTIINSGNGNLQNLLTFIQPRYYCTRAVGWACDVYVVGDYAILDGHDCIGKIKSYDLLKKYDGKAREILDKYRSGSKYYTEKRTKTALEKLIYKMIDEVEKL